MMLFRHRALLCTVLASLLGGAVFVVPAAWFLAPVSLALFFYSLVACVTRAREALAHGFLFGFATAGAGIAWFWDAYPLDWLGIASRVVQGEVLLMTWLMVSAALALGPAVVAVVIWKCRDNRFFPLIAAVLWVAAEEGRMWGFAALTWGAQSLVGPHFSAAALGFSFTENHYLLQLARFGGLRMLDFAVAMSAVLLMEGGRAWRRRAWRTLPLALATACMLTLIALPLLPAKGRALPQPLRAVLVTTQHEGGSLPREEAATETLALLKEAGSVSPDLIVFPEGHGLAEALPDADARAEAIQLLAPGALVMSADTVQTVEGSKVRLAYDTARDGTIASYDKLFFMPLGEYAPYLSLPIFSTLHDGDVSSFLAVREHSLMRGSGLTTVPYRGDVIGGLLCAESVSPDLYHALGQDGADVLVNLSNQVWFRHSRTLYARTLEWGKLHAVQNGAYYIMASNLSPSFVVSPDGRIVAQSAAATTSVTKVELR